MALPTDVVGFVSKHFPEKDRSDAFAILRQARIEDGSHPQPRLLRCAVMASRGSLESLRYYASLLTIDWRDVIVAGEYEVQGKVLARVRDLSQPLQV
jgi:hypothetical protein